MNVCQCRCFSYFASSSLHALFSFSIAASDYVNLGGNNPVRHPSSGTTGRPLNDSWGCFLNVNFRSFSDHGGVGSDRISDDSSKEAVSDSHPDTLTDPEFSDPPLVTSSPPQSGDEIRRDKDKVTICHTLFPKLISRTCSLSLFLEARKLDLKVGKVEKSSTSFPLFHL